METFNICWLAIIEEAKKSGVSFVNKSVKKFGLSLNFDLAPSRLEYLHRHGALIINLVAEGVLKSSQQLPQILEIFNEGISKQKCEIFSLSNGPGVEVVGFVYGFKKHVNALKNVSVCVATKCKEWKAISETLITGTFPSSYIGLIRDITFFAPNHFHFIPYEMTALSPEVRQNVQHCDVLLMYKSYECAQDVNLFKAILIEIFSIMKKDALLFFFDTRTRMGLFESLSGCGKILFGPQKISVKDIPCNDSLVKIAGVKPNQKGNVRFALWKKIVPSEKCNKINAARETIIPNFNVQQQAHDTLVNKNLEKCSPYASPFSTNAVDIKTIKETNWLNLLSNEESESDKSRAMSEISISSTHSTNQKFLKLDSPTNPIMVHGVNKEDSDCKESSKTSMLACIKDLNYQEETTDRSKLYAMIEHCEKMISVLENNAEKLTIKAPSSKNFHENCCNHNRKVPYNCYCPSCLQMPCSVVQCCNHSCHRITSHNEPVKFNYASRTSTSENQPYLLIPLGNEVLFTDTIAKLVNKN